MVPLCSILSQAYKREAKISEFTRVNEQMEKALSAFPYNYLPMSEEVREQVNYFSVFAFASFKFASNCHFFFIICFLMDKYS